MNGTMIIAFNDMTTELSFTLACVKEWNAAVRKRGEPLSVGYYLLDRTQHLPLRLPGTKRKWTKGTIEIEYDGELPVGSTLWMKYGAAQWETLLP